MKNLIWIFVFVGLISCGGDIGNIAKKKSQQTMERIKSIGKDKEKSKTKQAETKPESEQALQYPDLKQTAPEITPPPKRKAIASKCLNPPSNKSSEEFPYLFNLSPEPDYVVYKQRYFVGETSKGVRHGAYKEYHNAKNAGVENGKKVFKARIMYEGKYVKGKKQGVEKEYRSGALAVIRNFKNDLENGQTVWVDLCGNTMQTTDYKNGKMHGELFMYWDNGVKRSHRTYRDGQFFGVSRDWGRDGQQILELKREGQTQVYKKEWYPNGVNKLDERGKYKKTWYDTGYVEGEIIPAKGSIPGTKRFWYPNGNPMLSVNTDARDKPTGKVLRWDEDGRPISEKEWSKKVRKEKYKKYSKVAGEILLLPFEILIYGIK